MYMFEVCAKCGHVGKNFYVDKIFVVRASSGKEAARVVRNFPRVKHHHKDAIRYVIRIDEARYWEVRRMNDMDPYFLCHSIQEQRQTCEITPLSEKVTEVCENEDTTSKKRFFEGKKAIRNPKKYYYRFDDKERYAA
ncbi:hypothetical protein [Butyrivibrio sp. AE2032]|uniref:hypothetical protein n=1 Tax=Butyrivibrio sp. AE2032 TaxID=1458463 RepID=UPI00054E7660|nr:hypothetical protein [Butyrivibrio sp. AE2032]